MSRKQLHLRFASYLANLFGGKVRRGTPTQFDPPVELPANPMANQCDPFSSMSRNAMTGLTDAPTISESSSGQCKTPSPKQSLARIDQSSCPTRVVPRTDLSALIELQLQFNDWSGQLDASDQDHVRSYFDQPGVGHPSTPDPIAVDHSTVSVMNLQAPIEDHGDTSSNTVQQATVSQSLSVPVEPVASKSAPVLICLQEVAPFGSIPTNVHERLARVIQQCDGRTWNLTQSSQVGRRPQSDVVLDNGSVSRNHARIDSGMTHLHRLNRQQVPLAFGNLLTRKAPMARFLMVIA